jgi:HEAT repeat protein
VAGGQDIEIEVFSKDPFSPFPVDSCTVSEEPDGMETSTTGDPPTPAGSSQIEARKRPGISVRVLLLVICCAGAISWAGRMVWDFYHPLSSAVRGLGSADPSRREAAVREVSELGVDDSGAAIRSVLPTVGDPDAGVRASGAEALGVVGSYAVKSASEREATRAVVTALTALLKDHEPAVRGAAARALGAMAGTASRPATGRGRGRAGGVAKAVEPPPAAIDSMAVVASLLDLLADRDVAVRQAALSGLRDSLRRGVDRPPQPLVAAIEDESATNRAIAISILAGYASGLDSFVPALLRHLEQDEPQVRDVCRQALGIIRPSALSSTVMPVLVAGLKSPDRDVRLHLVTLLAGLKSDPRTAVPALIDVLREPIESDQAVMGDRTVSLTYEGPAQEAAKALGRIAPGTPVADDAIEALATVVRSGPQQRRAAAAGALAQFGPAAVRMVPDLVKFLQDADSSGEASRDADSAATALGRIAPGTPSGGLAVNALTAALRSGSPSTRASALRALQGFGPAAGSAVDAIRAVERDDPTPSIRKSAASTLEAIQGKSK